MGKKKKKKRRPMRTLLQILRPFIADDRVIGAIVNAAVTGVAWVAARKSGQNLAAVGGMVQQASGLVAEAKKNSNRKKHKDLPKDL